MYSTLLYAFWFNPKTPPWLRAWLYGNKIQLSEKKNTLFTTEIALIQRVVLMIFMQNLRKVFHELSYCFGFTSAFFLLKSFFHRSPATCKMIRDKERLICSWMNVCLICRLHQTNLVEFPYFQVISSWFSKR